MQIEGGKSGESMEYWVYVDDPTNRARVHKAACRFCNRGQGMKASRLPDNRWHGPFATKGQAVDKARITGRLDVRRCGFCLRSLGNI